MSELIPLSVPCIQGNEWKYIKECLDTGWISSGRFLKKFEDAICMFTGSKYAISCASGTAALHISLKIAGVSPNDEVIVPTLSFIASVNAVKYLNSYPVFTDCDDYYNMDIEKTIDFINKKTFLKNGFTYNKSTKRRISAIIPVHVFGNAVHLENLIGICKERNIRIVEDAAESLGTFYKKGLYKKKHTGTIGDIGCLSFNANKIITTANGGMILTNNLEYAEKAKFLISQAKNDEIRYIHNEIGYNYRLTNIQAALGVAQLEKLPEYIKIKKNNYKLYKSQIDNIAGLFLAEPPHYAESNYWFYCLQIDKNRYGKDREQLMGHLYNNKIQTRPIWFLNHLQKPYINCQNYKIEKALELIEKTLNIPCSINLKNDEIQKIISKLKF